MRNLRFLAILPLLTLLAVVLTGPAEALEVRPIYQLSDFSGTIPYSDVVVFADRHRDEVYTTTGSTVRVFNSSGMEIYRFGEDWELGMIYGLAVEPEGDVLLLAHQMLSDRPRRWDVIRCDYRGEPLGRLEIELPAELADFSPDRMHYGDDRIVLVSRGDLEAVILDGSGRFVESWDLADLLGVENPASQHIFGTGLDFEGNLLLTIPVLFKAYVVSPEAEVRRFGTPGSAPGLFGIASGIAADENGNFYVADRLRGVVMAFDPSLGFVLEFGLEPGRSFLVRPDEVTVGEGGRLYVTQARNRGVAVFSLTEPADQPVSEEVSTAATLGTESAPRSLLDNRD